MNRKTILSLTVVLLLTAAAAVAQIRVEPPLAERDARESKLRNSLKLIQSLVGIGNFEQAMMIITELENMYGDDPRILNEKKRVYHARKDFQALKLIIEEELNQDPGNFALTCQLGEALFLCDSLEKAESTWHTALEAAGNNEFNYSLLANYYQRFGYYNEAATVFKRARVVLNKPLLYANELSDIYLAQKNYYQAVTEYLNLIEPLKNPRDVHNISWQIMNIYDEADEPGTVIEAVNQAIKNNPSRSEYYVILGDLYLKTGQLPAAFSNYRQGDSLLSTKDRGLFLENFVRTCFDSGEYRMAVEVADYYLAGSSGRNNPAVEEIILIKARSLAELGIYQTAFEILDLLEKESARIQPRAEAIYAAGEIYADKLGDQVRAAERFSRLIKIAPNLPVAEEAQLKLAVFDINQARFDDAAARLGDMAKKARKKRIAENADFLLAEIRFFEGRFEDAIKEYNRLIAEYPNGVYVNDCLDRLALMIEAKDDSVLGLVARATWHNFAAHYDSAIALMKEASDHSGSKAYEFALYHLAIYYSQSGNWETAIGAYQHYLTAFEDGVYSDKATFNLAAIYYEKADQPEKANQLFNKLITDFPNSPLLEQARSFLNRYSAS